VTYQYCLWDFLRDLGQTEVGGLDRANAASSSLSGGKKNIRISRIVNVAKFYAQLISSHTLSLTILRTINFVSLTRESQVFLDVFLANLMLLLKNSNEDLKEVLLKVIHLPTLAQGLVLHIQGSLLQKDGNRTGLADDDMEVVRERAQIVKTILKTASSTPSSSSFD
jgi:nucleolar MIF4G domain-containing protein 1